MQPELLRSLSNYWQKFLATMILEDNAYPLIQWAGKRYKPREFDGDRPSLLFRLERPKFNGNLECPLLVPRVLLGGRLCVGAQLRCVLHAMRDSKIAARLAPMADCLEKVPDGFAHPFKAVGWL